MKAKERILSLLVAMCMVLALVPALPALATDYTYGAFTVTTDVTGGCSYSSSVLTISAGGEYTIKQTAGTSSSTSDRIKVTASDDVTINLAGVNISSSSASPFEITGSGDVTIKLSNTNTLKATGSSYAGLQKTSTSNALTITSAAGDGETSGSLTATGANGSDSSDNAGAGIGGGKNGAGKNITINGGTIVANGGGKGAGIGGAGGTDSSKAGTADNITINGGTVTATAQFDSAGIGSGSFGSAANITITGGTVTATGVKGVGIGAGAYSSCDGITITGGTVKATSSTNGTAIGDGYSGTGYGTITISGGYITASAASGAKNTIGSYTGSSSGTVTITGGYFADSSATTGVGGKVYSISVGEYCVYANDDAATSSTYPYYVSSVIVTKTVGDFKVTSAGDSGYSYSDNVLDISDSGEYTIAMADGVASTSADRIKVTASDDVTITLSGVSITSDSASPFEIDTAGNVTVILDGDNTLTSTAEDYAGLQKTSTGNALTISGDGSLTANGGSNSAGIGGGANGAGSNITIVNGYIAATGYCAIGSGNGGSEASVNIISGYFADTNATLGEGGTVYGITVAGVVSENDDEATSSKYGYVVTAATKEISLGDFKVTTLESNAYYNYCTYSSNVLTISGGDEYIIAMADEVTSTSSDRINIAASDDVIITLSSVQITSSSASPFNITGSGDVTIKLDGDNVFDAGSTSDYAGLQKTTTDNTLTITSASGDGETDGTLTTTGAYGAGIGGGKSGAGSNITINGGTITATGNYAAGIGGGYQGAGSYITITGGSITTTTGNNSAGIGGGYQGAGSYIEISGGIVSARGGGAGAGIGGGTNRTGSYITISGGSVTTSSYNGAGIGGGYQSTGSNITITGGTVTSEKRTDGGGAGIGGGGSSAGNDITISGGYITVSLASSKAKAIGGGSGGSTGTVTITGGYFGTGDIDAQTVYSISVADDYQVVSSGNSTYPYKVRPVAMEFGDFSVVVDSETACSYENGVLTISEGGEYTIYQTAGTDSATSDTIKITADADVIITLAGVNIESTAAAAIEITGSGNVTIKLEDENILDASAADDCAGLQTSSTSTLTITSAEGDGETSGTLIAVGGANSAGIGGGKDGDCAGITISGGVIEATAGANGAAGIGGGSGGTLTGISVTGGWIVTTGSTNEDGSGNANAIGGGADESAADLSSATNAVIIDGAAATGDVYGDYALTDDVTLAAENTLTISAETTLTVNSGATLTNNGTIVVNGTLTNNGTIINNGKIIGSGTLVPPIEASLTIESCGKTYDGEAADENDISYTYTGDGEVSLAWYSDNDGAAGESIDAPTNSGTYWVKLSTAETKLFEAAESETVQFVIEKAAIVPGYDIPTDLTALYCQTLETVELPSGWAWDDVTTSVGGVGTKTFAATYTQDDNHETATHYLEITVTDSGDLWVETDVKNSFTYSANVLEITEGGEYTITMADGVLSTSKDRIVVSADDAVTITLSDVSITSTSAAPVEITGDGAVTIKLDGDNTLKTTDGSSAGLQKTSSTALTISGAGGLSVSGGTCAIGSGAGDASNISIIGGYFADGDFTSGTVYGVEVGDGYSAIDIPDVYTIEKYACVVVKEAGDFLVMSDSGSGYSYDSNVLEITAGGAYVIMMNGVDETTSDSIKVTASGDATITIIDLKITSTSASPFEVDADGDVTVILSGENTFTTSGNNCAGLQKTSSNNELIITSIAGDGETEGTLTAQGGNNAAGIGGKGYSGSSYEIYNITINGGTIAAKGGGYAAGLGGGFYGLCYYITINGGTVTATGGSGAAGIGSGYGRTTQYITITGGTVTANTGDSNAGGIGSSIYQYTSDITISGGYIIASSIKGGGSTGTVTITGGYFASGSTSANTACGITVADGYTVYTNVEDTASTYKYRVLATNWADTTSVTYNTPSDVTGTAPEYDGDTSYGTLVEVDTTLPYSKSGYRQAGWSLSEDSTDIVTSFYITEDEITLYPVFERAFKATDKDANLKFTLGTEIEEIDLNDYLQFADSDTFDTTSGEFTFAVADGSELPEGLTLSEDGIISGTPTKAMEATEINFVVTDKMPYLTLFSLDSNEAYSTATLTLTFAVSGYTLRAEVTSTDDGYNPYDEITLDIYLTADEDENVTAVQMAFAEDWYTLVGAESDYANYIRYSGDTGIVSFTCGSTPIAASTVETKIATVTLQVNEDAPTDTEAEIEFDLDYSYITTEEYMPLSEDAPTVAVYNLTLELTTDDGASFTNDTDPTIVYMRYNEANLYSDAERSVQITALPEAEANAKYELKGDLWTLTIDGSSEEIAADDLLARTWTASGAAIPTALHLYDVTINAPSDTYGTITYDGTDVSGTYTVTVNEETTFGDIISKIEFTTADNTAYVLTTWQLNDSETYYTAETTETVSADAALYPMPIASEFTMTLQNGDNWSFDTITGAEDNFDDTYIVTYNTNVEFTLTADEGYAIYDVYYSVDGGTGVSIKADDDGKFTIPGSVIIADVTLEVNAKAYYVITFAAGEGSTMTDGTYYAWDAIGALYATYSPLGLSEMLSSTDTATIINDLEGDTTDCDTTGEKYRLAADSDAEPLWTDANGATATTLDLLTKVFTEDTDYTANAVKQYRVKFAEGGDGFSAYADGAELELWIDTGSTIADMGLALPGVTASEHYEFAYWTLDNAGEYSDDDLTAETITEAYDAVPVFTKIKYTVEFYDFGMGEFGDITGVEDDGNGGYTAQWNEEDITFTFTADQNYDITDICYTVDGGEENSLGYEEDKTYTIEKSNITGVVRIYVEADAIRTYTFMIAAADSAKGTLGAVSTIVTYVDDNPDMSEIDLTPSAGYDFLGWSYDGTTYTKDEIEAETVTADTLNRTYTAVFKETDLEVTYDGTYLEITSGLDEDGYAHIGEDLVIEQVGDIAILEVTYKIGDGEAVTLTASDEGIYTIPGSVLTEDITITVTTVTDAAEESVDFEFIFRDDYFGIDVHITEDRKILLLPTNELEGAYKLTKYGAFYYSEQYGAYVIWVNKDETSATLSAQLSYDASGTTTEISYDGDINMTGIVTAGDAGIINDVLKGRYDDSLTDLQLFMLDVSQESAYQVATSDVVKVLKDSVK